MNETDDGFSSLNVPNTIPVVPPDDNIESVNSVSNVISRAAMGDIDQNASKVEKHNTWCEEDGNEAQPNILSETTGAQALLITSEESVFGSGDGTNDAVISHSIIDASTPRCESEESGIGEEYGKEISPLSKVTRSPSRSPGLSPINEDHAIEHKRHEEELFEKMDEGGNKISQEENGDLPIPTAIPQNLIKLADNHNTGLVVIRVPISTIITKTVHSKTVTVLGLSWRIFSSIDKDKESVSIFLQCLEKEEEYECYASTIIYRLHHPTDYVRDYVKSASHNYNLKENDWGFRNFVKADNFPSFVQNDGNLLFSCEFKLEHPQGIRFLNDETRIPVGLFNQGATCYLNVAIQILFSTKCIRQAILEMDLEDDDNGILSSLQRLFYRMHTSIKGQSTEMLTNSFGWKGTDASFTHHDVQEMMNILLDKIERAFQGTKHDSLVNDLFKTKTRTFIRCLDVEFESGRDEYCLDVQLPVRRQDGSNEPLDVLGALREVTMTEVLDGDNKYDALGHGLQRAEKGIKFISFPKVLHIQLLRFQMNYTSGESMKLNDRVEFSDILDLSEFIEENDERPCMEYALHGVVCHFGSALRGHYIFYSTNFPGADAQKWFRFDDSVVTRVAKESVISEEHFGSNESPHSFNAYMLTYIRTDVLREVLHDFPLSTIFPPLRDEMGEEEIMRNRMITASGDYSIRFVTEPEAMSIQVWDHFDYIQWRDEPYRLKLNGDESAIKLFHEAENFTGGRGTRRVRLFVMERRKRRNERMGTTWRIKRELDNRLVESQVESVESVLGEEKKEHVVFIMTSQPVCPMKKGGEKSIKRTRCESEKKEEGEEREEREERDGDEKTIFIKYYDGHTLRYVAPLKVPPGISMYKLSECLCVAANLNPTSHIKFWKEKWFDELEEVNDLMPIDVDMGDIVVFESVHLIGETKPIQLLLDHSKRLIISLNACTNKRCNGFIMEEENDGPSTLNLPTTCIFRKLLNELSILLNHPSEKIMLWANGKCMKTEQLDDKISSLIIGHHHDPREESKITLEFARLSVTREESENYVGMIVSMRIDGDSEMSMQWINMSPCLFDALKDKVMTKYHEKGDMERLRFVRRFKQGSGYFTFREITSNENMIASMELPCRVDDSLVICVDEMAEEEMEEMGEDNTGKIILPVIITTQYLVKDFLTETPTFFIKIRKDDEISTIKSLIQAKWTKFTFDWEVDRVAVYTGAKYNIIDYDCPLDLSSLYHTLHEEPGLSESKDTVLYLSIIHRNDPEEQKKDSPQFLRIRD